MEIESLFFHLNSILANGVVKKITVFNIRELYFYPFHTAFMTFIREVMTVKDTISYENSLTYEKTGIVQPGVEKTPGGLYYSLSILIGEPYER